MLFVADTSPLNYLILIEEIEILPKLCAVVFVPEAVTVELQHQEAPLKIQNWISGGLPAWLQKTKPSITEPGLESLGHGEREAITLAIEKSADGLLIDDREGRRAAAKRGLRVVGTLALLDEAARQDILDFEEALSRLRQTNFRLSPQLLERLRNLNERER